jgi:flagellar basal body-associated protein FliL
MSQNPRYGNPPPLRKGLASARERQKPVPQASAMQDISPSWIILSVLPIVVLLGLALITMWLGWKRKANESRKDEFLNRLGYLATADGVGQEEKETGTSELRNRKIKAQLSPKESKASKKPIIVGFWHPYW